MYCVAGASQECRCHIDQFQDKLGQSSCKTCVGQAVPRTGQPACVTEVAYHGTGERKIYMSIIGVFVVVALCGAGLVVLLARSRQAFSVRPFHSGICLYFASFVPYAALKAVAVGMLLDATTQQQELDAGLFLNGSFMIFFWLGFGGKMALVQLWMHLISRHAGGSGQNSLAGKAQRTWKLLRITVLTVCALYSICFISLVVVYSQAASSCATDAGSADCIPISSNETPTVCQHVLDLASGILYFEGLFAAVVVVVFTCYALVFNGLVYAMLTSDPTFSNLSKLQRMLIHSTILRRMLRPYANPSP